MADKTFLKSKMATSLLLVVLAFAGTVHAKIIYVDDDGPADFNNIQAAIDEANDGDIIVVNTGTYTSDGNRDIDFLGKAITVRSIDPNDPNIVDSTIIDCNHLGRGFFFHSGEDGNSILSGLTIMNGRATIGGGICCENQSGPTIANCVIKRNRADGGESDGFGGGISGSNGKIVNCTISRNIAAGMSYGSGGGLYDCNGTIIDCRIISNAANVTGGGLSECNGDIVNCTISGNWITEEGPGRVWVGSGGGLFRCTGQIINSAISGNVIIAEYQAFGGGLYDCNGPIIDCSINGNTAHSEIDYAYGGGLYRCDGAIINCEIKRNTLSTNGLEAGGGGLCGCDGTISNCTISDNSAEGGWGWTAEGSWGLGGGLCWCNGTIINCTISDNTATVTVETPYKYSGGAGGGLYGCSGTITNCNITGNTATELDMYEKQAFDGGLRVYDETIADSAIAGNTASDVDWSEQRAFGGGLCGCDGTISNCVIGGNIVLSKFDSSGGGLCGCDGTIINCTISGNAAKVTVDSAESDASGGGLDWCNGTITNCIIWANSANTDSQICSSSEPNYCCLQDYAGSGTGNIDADPCFVEFGYWDVNGLWINGDYHLLQDSPCIDAGDPNYIAEPNETDLDGNPRMLDGDNDGIAIVDMGAYEYSPTIPAKARILPRTINLTSKGNWVTCYIWLPEEYDVADIDPNSVFLEDNIKPEQFSVDEQQQVAAARFNREDVQAILDIGDIELTITGRLNDGIPIEAKDTVRVIDKNSQKSPE